MNNEVLWLGHGDLGVDFRYMFWLVSWLYKNMHMCLEAYSDLIFLALRISWILSISDNINSYICGCVFISVHATCLA